MKIGPRRWCVNDTVAFHFPMTLRFEQLDDDRSEWQGVGSILYGPLMLASVGPQVTDRLPIDIANLEAHIKRNSTDQLSFEVAPNLCSDGPAHLIPFSSVMEEEYAVYFHTAVYGPVINASIPALPGADQKAWKFQGGASIQAASGGGYDIRTGSPHQRSIAELEWPIMDRTHHIVALKFGYHYVTGYSASGTGTNFSLVLKPCHGAGTAIALYASPGLRDYPYDKCHTWPACYSPRVNAEAVGLDVVPSKGLRLSLEFENNDRNLQIHLPLNFSITWSNGVVTTLLVGRRALPHEYPADAGAPWGARSAMSTANSAIVL